MSKNQQRAQKPKSNNEYITTHNELKNFTEQVGSNVFPDPKFRKAYEKFKRPSYYQTGGGNTNERTETD